ncbi:MAG: hypothetical protein ACD_3C00043G0008 [uncultured bacterium (gcode 4)]|uniref:Uncharacterized protein n=1 Tax=uncultured bacterium (gcode 4) TaxID=1234023 RepID=K2GEB0_9BACT|nr:MAG: hypothetical protein ACD_3C00043G0008 [uncultured bacterium (gcode 4)]
MESRFKNKRRWFTIVELLVAILIFTIWWLSAYLLVYAAIGSSLKAKNEIIAWNLAREKIELIKNMRDTNWVRVLDWNKLDNSIIGNNAGTTDLTSGYFKIENDFQLDTNLRPSIKLQKLNGFIEDRAHITDLSNSQNRTMLCLDSKWRYSYVCSPWDKPTKFYAFLKVSPLNVKNSSDAIVVVDKALKIDAIVYNYEKSFNKFIISTIITDWKR